MSIDQATLLEKYDVPVPRYTSYPTVPYWNETPGPERWITSVRDSIAGEGDSWSLYIHVPFCEKLCTYCGCNTVITRDHGNEAIYVRNLHQEWSLYRDAVPGLGQRRLKQIHIGGGTPTFLTPANLAEMLRPILDEALIDPEAFEGGIEVDPRVTTPEQLQGLFGLGFRRVSMGVQDFNPETQRLVNRIQPYDTTAELLQAARSIGYTSVNFDLIYGLPRQDETTIVRTIEQTLSLRPDRIAFYSMALVPWIKPQQRIFKDEDLPKGVVKRKLYEIGRDRLLAAGYAEIGNDHFALPTDELYKSSAEKRLHRNFMGYTEQRTSLLLGLGVSAISESADCYHQNEKKLPLYQQALGETRLPTLRGHILNEEDRRYRQRILEFMTRFEAPLDGYAEEEEARSYLSGMIEDGLVEILDGKVRLTGRGKPFLRNACTFFDQHLKRGTPDKPIFSRSI